MTQEWLAGLLPEGATLTEHGFALPGGDSPRPQAIPLCQLGCLACDGEDAATFLHNLCSNDIAHLAPTGVQWNSFNSPKGRMLASFLLRRSAEGLRLYPAADLAPALARKLSLYVLRAKARITDLGARTALIGLQGAQTATVLARLALPCPPALQQAAGDEVTVMSLGPARFVLEVPAAQAGAWMHRLTGDGGAGWGDTNAWELGMIRAGLPTVTVATQEAFVAQMLNYDLIGGISFKKGCYPGQEIIARTRYLGKIKKRMFRFALPADSAPVIGDAVLSADFGEQSAGKLVNVARTADGFEVLAVAQRDSAQNGELRLRTPDGPRLTCLPLPYELADAPGGST